LFLFAVKHCVCITTISGLVLVIASASAVYAGNYTEYID